MTNVPGPPIRSRTPETGERLGPIEVLILAAWCGLAGGELEVAARVIPRAFGATQRLYLMTRHFVWLVPLINLALFLVFGLLLSWAARRWPGRAGWWSPRLLVALAIFPVLTVAFRGIYLEAWLLVALGLAFRLAPVLERHRLAARRWLAWCVPVLLGLVLLQAGWVVGVDRIKQWREAGRPRPPAGAPNVLLIVLDTVRADHLSLYGYPRPTSPNLDRLARRGIRFDRARAAAPWTLASHANMFTGRWPHELAIAWSSPLRGRVPTLAEHLGSLGYATAGFVGNTIYCSYDCGLDRGFTHYQDYVLDWLAAARTLKLVDEPLKTIGWLGRLVALPVPTLVTLSHGPRKAAPVVSREFLDWLSRRSEPSRPFFAFLNYVDAHTPYLLPPGVAEPLGSPPRTDAELRFLSEGWTPANARQISRTARMLAIDAYDNCLAYLDEQVGRLLDALQRRGVLDQTLVIVTADHGEGLGEHGLSDHGESLYRPEIGVPLVIVLPADRRRAPAAIGEFVSLRDLPATIAEVVHPGKRSPIPGRSLLPPRHAGPARPREDDRVVLSELAAPNPADPNRGRSPAVRGPLIALAEADFVYIRNQGDGTEEVFNQRVDPHELANLAGAEAMQALLRRFRDRLEQATAPTPAPRDAGTATRVAAAPKVPVP